MNSLKTTDETAPEKRIIEAVDGEPVTLADSNPTTDHPDTHSIDNEVASPSQPTVDQPELLLKTIANYKVLRKLGSGGFGVVYLGLDDSLNRYVAIKVPRNDILLTRSFIRRFLKEAQNVAKLDHPNIVPVLSTTESDNRPVIVYHFCDGPTLSKWSKSQTGQLSFATVARIGVLLANAVQHAHSRGILHRDLKPSNILLERATSDPKSFGFSDGDDAWVPRVTDFGISSGIEENDGDSSSTATITQGGFGTLEYMPPEQLMGKRQDIGTYSDVYSLGVILYELIAKQRPFAARSVVDSMIRMHSSEPKSLAKLVPSIPGDLEAIILRCLEVDERLRYRTAEALAEDLQRYIDRRPVEARLQSRWQRTKSWVRRKPLVSALMAVCFVLTFFFLTETIIYLRSVEGLVHKLSITNQQTKKALRAENELAERFRKQAYSSDIASAERAFRDRDLLLFQDLMLKQQPGLGESDLREDAWMHLWRRGTRKEKSVFNVNSPLYAIKLDSSGKTAAVCGADGRIYLRDLQTDIVTSWPSKQGEINGLAFSNNDKLLATVGDDGSVSIWDIATQELLQRIRAHEGRAFQVEFISDTTLATSGNEPSIMLWNWQSGQLIKVLSGHTKSVQSLTISTDRLTLYSGSDDGKRIAWDLNDGSIRNQLESHEARVLKVALLPSSSLLISSDVQGKVRTANFAPSTVDQQLIATMDDSVESVAVDQNSGRVAMGTREGAIHIAAVDREGNALPSNFQPWLGHRGRVYDLRFSTDGSTLHSLGEDGRWKQWELKNSTDEFRLSVDEINFVPKHHRVQMDQLSPDRCIYSVANELFTWSPQDKDPQWVGSSPQSVTKLLAPISSHCSPQESVVFTGHAEGKVRAWRYTQGNLESEWEMEWPGLEADLLAEADITGIGYSDKRNWLAVSIATPSTRIQILDAKTGRVIRELTPDFDTAENEGDIAFSSDGNYLAAAFGQNIQLWNLSNDTSRLLKGHTNTIATLKFQPDSSQLVSGSDDRSIRFWNVDTGEGLSSLRHHKSRVTSLSFTESGNSLYSTDAKGITAIWHVPSERLLIERDHQEPTVEIYLSPTRKGEWMFRVYASVDIVANRLPTMSDSIGDSKNSPTTDARPIAAWFGSSEK